LAIRAGQLGDSGTARLHLRRRAAQREGRQTTGRRSRRRLEKADPGPVGGPLDVPSFTIKDGVTVEAFIKQAQQACTFRDLVQSLWCVFVR